MIWWLSVEALLSCQPRATVSSCFVYKVIQDLESIYHLCINPICRIGLIHKWSIDSRLWNRIVQGNALLNYCKQTITSLSLSVGTPVDWPLFLLLFLNMSLKGDSNPNNKYVLSDRALLTMNFDTSIIKIGWKMGKLWAFKEFTMADI